MVWTIFHPEGSAGCSSRNNAVVSPGFCRRAREAKPCSSGRARAPRAVTAGGKRRAEPATSAKPDCGPVSAFHITRSSGCMRRGYLLQRNGDIQNLRWNPVLGLVFPEQVDWPAQAEDSRKKSRPKRENQSNESAAFLTLNDSLPLLFSWKIVMRVRTKLTAVYIAIVAAVLGCSTYIFLRAVDGLALLLRSSFTDALLPLKAIQNAQLAFDDLEYDERDLLRPPFIDLD